MAEELYTFEKPKEAVLDLMGNELLRGHIVAYSKGGRGERGLYVGVITSIVKMGGHRPKYSHAIHCVTSGGWWGTEHRINVGVNTSVILLNDPLYSLNSKKISKLFEMIEDVRGKEHGDVRPYLSWDKKTYYRDVKWKNLIPEDYKFGTPIDEDQMITIPNKPLLDKIKKDKVKARNKKAKK